MSMNYRVGIDIGASKTKILLMTKAGKVLVRKRIVTNSFGSPEPIVEKASRAVHEMLKKKRIKTSQVEGVGVGVAGQLYPETGYIDNSPNLEWFGVNFGKNLQKRMGMKVRIANDVNAAAWGEFLYGAGKKYRDVVVVLPGSGIGGGIIANGLLVEGATGTAAEVGHMIFRENGRRCDCGRYGCHEAYAGGMPMEKRMRRAVSRGKSPMVKRMVKGDLLKINTRTIADAARKGDRVAGRIWREARSSLGVLCSDLITALNPECLVLGGGVIEGNPSLVPYIRRYVKDHAVRLSAQKARIVTTRLKGDAVAMGGAALFDLDKKKGPPG
jgi:glucokinase